MSLDVSNFGWEEPLILWLIIPLSLLLYFYLREKGRKMTWGRKIFLISRIIIFSLILIALASPYLIQVKDEFQAISIKIISDKSPSMQLFPQNVGEEIYFKINLLNESSLSFNLQRQEISGDNKRTEFGNALYQSIIQENRDDILILTTDGFNNYGRNPLDVARILRDSTKIFVLTPNQTKAEIYLSLLGGEKKIPLNTEYNLGVEISKLGGTAKYTLNLLVDGRKVRQEEVIQSEPTKRVDFTFSFVKSGVHVLEVEIIPLTKDYFVQNNHLSKVIDVVERLQVLVITPHDNSPLIKVLETNYQVHISPRLEENFQHYDLVILDDQSYDKLSLSQIDAMSGYLTDGNGLVVIGGGNSFERGNYLNSPLERILPVSSTEKPEEKRNPIAVVFLIDVSASLGYYSYTEEKYCSQLDQVKAVIINLLRQLDDDDSTSLVAFTHPPAIYTLVELTPIGENRNLIEDIVLKLKPTKKGGTQFTFVLARVEEILKDYNYEKYVILLADGFVMDESDIILDQARSLANKGIKVYAVGVGDVKSVVHEGEGEDLMQDIATEGGGLYYYIQENQRLNAVFKEEEQAEVEGMYPLKIYDKYHFITKDLELDARIESYNGVTAKSIARILVSTLDKKPIVTTWRFGLGRVVTLTTDNGAFWSPQLYQAAGGKLISRITNWAIGDLEKGKGVRLDTQDIPLGETAGIMLNLKSKSLFEKPKLYLKKDGGREELGLKQIDLDKFSSRFTPNETGIFKLAAESRLGVDTDAIAVNPSREYFTLGVNGGELLQIAEITNASFYNLSQLDLLVEEISQQIEEGSVKKVKGKENLTIYFLLAALSLFFIDVMTRRIKDIFALKKAG